MFRCDSVCVLLSFFSWQLLSTPVCLESVMTMPEKMCLTFCAQTLVHTQPIKRLSHLETGLLVPHPLHSVEVVAKAGFFRIWSLLRKPETGQASWCLTKIGSAGNCSSLFFFWDVCLELPETVLPLCLPGSFTDFKSQLNKNALIKCTLSTRPFCFLCEGTWPVPVQFFVDYGESNPTWVR